jgi:hypothetical protein
MHFNTVLPSTPVFYRLPPFKLPNKNFVRASHQRQACPTPRHTLHLIILIISDEEYKA